MGSHPRKERRHRVDENEHARGREHKRHRREEDGTTRHHDEDRESRSQRPRSSLQALKSMQQLSSMNPGHSTFVQQWLGQVDGGEGKKGPEKMLLCSRDHPHRHKNSKIAEMETLHKMTPRHDDRHRSSRKDARQKRRHTPSDSSMLQPANDSTHIDTRIEAMTKALYNRPSLIEEDGQRKRKYALDDDPSSSSELPQANEIFDKRRRHKTKEDRYDAKAKKSKAAVENKTAKKNAKKFKRGDGAKILRAAGEDLIRSFASNKVAKERLTVRPGAGIFWNGKASSPPRKHGIADLAFSEMDFLSHSKNKAAAVEKEVVTSKHGQKMQRERERTRNEISDYFAPRQPPLPSAPNRHHRRSPLLPSKRYATTLASSELGGTSTFEPRSPRWQRAILKEQYLGFGTNISSPRKFSLPPTSHEPIYVRPSVESERSDLSSSTSCVSWSETAKSASRHGSPARKLDERMPSTSSSPSMLRMRLIESGMLDGLCLSQCPPSKYRPDTHLELSARKRSFNQQHLHRCHTAPDTDSSVPGALSRRRENEFRINQSNTSDQLRRQQIEAARRAISSPHLVPSEKGDKLEARRSILASRAYLRPAPSGIPRRAATTTPLRQCNQNRVLNRSSLQHEIMQDPRLRDVSARAPAEIDQNGTDSRELMGDYADYYLDLPSHIRMPVYGRNGHSQQLWTQDQMPELGYDDRMEPSPICEPEKDRQNQQYQCSDFEQDEKGGQQWQQPRYEENALHEARTGQPYAQSFTQQYYRGSSLQGDGKLADFAIDYSQPLPESDAMSQYFQTPRGQEYFQQRGLERSDLLSGTHSRGLLEDEMKGFWATKRW